MDRKISLTASIVLYNEEDSELSKVVNSFLNTPISKKLYLIDNSPTDEHKKFALHSDIEYIFNKRNIGFGAANNIVLHKIINYSKYHLILNPDVTFESRVIPNLIKVLEKENDVAVIAPKVLFSNGKHQYSCRRYPSLFEQLVRRVVILKELFSTLIKKGKYYDKDLTQSFYPEFLQGCFLLFKTKDFVQIKGFDERYFLYMEDVDICKKIDAIGKKKMYYPNEEISHVLKKGSSKNIRLFIQHLLSSIKYFFKWGLRR